MDLVMKSNETINVFYIRVKWAMEVKNHSIAISDKALALYIADRDRDLFTFFLAGSPSKYREFAMTGENPPTNPTTLRKRCAQLEAMQSRTKRIAALSAKVNKENPKSIEESPIEVLTKEIAALKAEMKCFNSKKRRDTLPQLAPIQRNQSQAEAEETGADGEPEEIEDKDNEEEEVINLLLTTAKTANISYPLSGSTTAEEEEAEEDAVAPMPSVTRARALTPATADLTLATTALVRLATPLSRISIYFGTVRTHTTQKIYIVVV
jgi:hypothetical protein